MSLNNHNSSKIDFDDADYDDNPTPYSASNDSGNNSTMLPQTKTSPTSSIIEISEEATNKKIHTPETSSASIDASKIQH